jgi:anti-sigma factor RsiW
VTCRELVEFLTDYLEGILPEPQRDCFEAHLAECPDCGAYLTTYRETVRIVKTVYLDDPEPVPMEVPSELVRAILSAQRLERPR